MIFCEPFASCIYLQDFNLPDHRDVFSSSLLAGISQITYSVLNSREHLVHTQRPLRTGLAPPWRGAQARLGGRFFRLWFASIFQCCPLNTSANLMHLRKAETNTIMALEILWQQTHLSRNLQRKFSNYLWKILQLFLIPGAFYYCDGNHLATYSTSVQMNKTQEEISTKKTSKFLKKAKPQTRGAPPGTARQSWALANPALEQICAGAGYPCHNRDAGHARAGARLTLPWSSPAQHLTELVTQRYGKAPLHYKQRLSMVQMCPDSHNPPKKVVVAKRRGPVLFLCHFSFFSALCSMSGAA